MRIHLKTSLVILAMLFTSQIAAARTCPTPWQSAVAPLDDCNLQEFSLRTWSGWTGLDRDVKAKIRSGYLSENSNVPFRGNVIYFEGLGDSMVNHMPMFRQLTDAGYRVIAFDYMGQGGSSGDMNDTRIYEIGALGDKIWSLHARDLSHFPKKNIVGWSTGGLAAYAHASIKVDVNNIVLIAPGIAPNMNVGEQNILQFKFNQITLPTLTTQVYGAGVENPHIDPIKPSSPLKVLDFAWDLMVTAAHSQTDAISGRVNGFILLSGNKDTYVNARKTLKIRDQFAPHFQVRQYPGSLHEIDNEAEPNRSKAHRDIVDFLNRTN